MCYLDFFSLGMENKFFPRKLLSLFKFLFQVKSWLKQKVLYWNLWGLFFLKVLYILCVAPKYPLLVEGLMNEVLFFLKAE